MKKYQVTLPSSIDSFYTTVAKCLNINIEKVLENTLQKSAELMASMTNFSDSLLDLN